MSIVSNTQLKKMFSNKIGCVSKKFSEKELIGDTFCLIEKDENMVYDHSRKLELNKFPGLYNSFACKETGIRIKDSFGNYHDILSYINLEGNLDYIIVQSKYESIYSGRKIILQKPCSTISITNIKNETGFIISANYLGNAIQYRMLHSFMEGIKYTPSYEKIAREIKEIKEIKE